MFSEHKYLTDEQLQGFEHYKYSSIDTNPLSIYVMHPFWNYIIQFFPKWVAPNLLTFAGFLFTVFNLILFSYYDYGFQASSEEYPDFPPIPTWVFYVAAVNIFLAYTLDGIDGKQARRTKTSSPLGELFDHGLDSYTAAMIPISLFSVFGRDGLYSVSPLRMYLICWNVFLCFYLSHWEKYNTGILFLPWGYDISMCGSTVLFLFSGLFTVNIFKFRYYGVTGGVAFELILHLTSLFINIPVIFNNIYKSYVNKTGKMYTLGEAVRPLWPLLYFFILTTVWIAFSPSNILYRDPRIFLLFMGTVFSNICCQLIISQMSNTRCEVFNWLFLPSTAAVFMSTFLFSNFPSLEILILHTLCFFVTLAHIHYGTNVVQQLCKHFKIDCFHISVKED